MATICVILRDLKDPGLAVLIISYLIHHSGPYKYHLILEDGTGPLQTQSNEAVAMLCQMCYLPDQIDMTSSTWYSVTSVGNSYSCPYQKDETEAVRISVGWTTICIYIHPQAHVNSPTLCSNTAQRTWLCGYCAELPSGPLCKCHHNNQTRGTKATKYIVNFGKAHVLPRVTGEYPVKI